MTEINDISNLRSALLTYEGSSIDINLGDVDNGNACDLIDHLCSIYQLESATNSEGKDIKTALLDTISRKETILTKVDAFDCNFQEDKQIIKRMLVLLGGTINGKRDIELSFFPDYVQPQLQINSFLNFMKTVSIISGVECYYVRSENASWEFGDTSSDSGIIFVGSSDAVN